MQNYKLNIILSTKHNFGFKLLNLIISIFFVICILFINSCEFDSSVTNFGTKVKSEIVWKVNPETLDKINIISEKYFDKNGKLIKVINYNEDGNKVDESSFIYNKNESKETKITFKSDGQQLIQDYNYIYNETGKIEKKILIVSNDTTKKHITNYTYDKLGNIIKIIETNFVESVEVKTTESKLVYNYSNNGSISEIIYNNQNPDSIIFRDSLVYNKSEKSLKMYQIDRQNSRVSSVLYNYNSLGNIILTSYFDKNSNIISKQSHIYTYHN